MKNSTKNLLEAAALTEVKTHRHSHSQPVNRDLRKNKVFSISQVDTRLTGIKRNK